MPKAKGWRVKGKRGLKGEQRESDEGGNEGAERE